MYLLISDLVIVLEFDFVKNLTEKNLRGNPHTLRIGLEKNMNQYFLSNICFRSTLLTTLGLFI